jgi:hypothetical protein
MDLAPPEGLPPWYGLQLASFFRRAAVSGYLPPEEEGAYFRLALRALSEAEETLKNSSDGKELLPFVLSEKGLALAESTLSDPSKGKDTLSLARKLWDEADSLKARSSGYARARWAAWSGSREDLEKLLAHDARDEDTLLWPGFSEALQEPAFRSYTGDHRFKALWFGYSR